MALDPITEHTRKPTWLDRISAVLAYGMFHVLSWVSIDTASNVCGWLARTLGPRVGVSKTARRNLALAFPDKTPEEVETIVKDVWENFGRLVGELPHIDRLINDPNDTRIEIVGIEHVTNHIAQQDSAPIIFFSAHLGNWETGPAVSARLKLPLNAFYRPPNNPLMNNLFNKRQTTGEMIPKSARGAKRAYSLLKRGEHLGVLIDQKLNTGIPLPFFGRDAMTGTSIAEYALRFNSPIIGVETERLQGAHFRITLHPPLQMDLSSDREQNVRAIMTRINQDIESWIRKRPGQWLWLHNRWPK